VTAVSFGTVEAARAAQLSVRLRRARGREVDLAIAACALTLGAHLWTLNPDDFQNLSGLQLYEGT
jgi:predicted nucleic acid-binding protein